MTKTMLANIQRRLLQSCLEEVLVHDTLHGLEDNGCQVNGRKTGHGTVKLDSMHSQVFEANFLFCPGDNAAVIGPILFFVLIGPKEGCT